MLSPVLRSCLVSASLLLPWLGVERFAGPVWAAPRTTPLRVPLQWVANPDNPSIRKLGIRAALNGGSPQLFEFDTGGTGFFATFATNTATASPWWGSNPVCTTTPCTPFTTTYDSGLTYQGNLVAGSVSLYGASVTPLLTATNVNVGQTISIACATNGDCSRKSGKADESGWNSSTGLLNPPVQGNFYGDFGLSLRNGASGGPNSLITQAAFWALFDSSLITQGYRVHAASADPWVQFGLTAADLHPPLLRFALNSTGGTPTGSLQVSQGSSSFSGAGLTTLIFDTGATTTIHTGAITINGVSFPPGNFPCSLTSEICPFPSPPPSSTTVNSGAQVAVSGLSLSSGQEEPFLSFVAGSTTTTSTAFNQVVVQGYSPTDLAPACVAFGEPCYYLNTGILPFLNNDVIVNLHAWSATNPSGELSLVPQVPAPPALLAPGAAFAAARRLRRRLRLAQRKA
jgi:hypothetical protein